MPMYNLIEYSSNCSETTGVFSFYSKIEATNFDTIIANNNGFKSFKYKPKLLVNTAPQADNFANVILKNAKAAVSLKHFQ